MTIETLNTIKADASSLRTDLLDMADKVSLVEAEGLVIPAEVDTALDSILVDLNTILTWVDLAIQTIEDGGNTGEIGVMQAMLAELKAVFEKYSAVLSVIDGTEGYGEGYGEGSADVIQFTVTDPVSGQVTTKEFIQTTLSAVDLV